MIAQQEQQKVNEAADQFTDALVQSYKTVVERGTSAQEQNAQLTEVFVKKTINNLHAQAEENRQASQQLADQQQRQADAAQTPYPGVGRRLHALHGLHVLLLAGGHTNGRTWCQGNREGDQRRKELESN